MPSEIAIFESQNAANLQATYHPRQRLARLGQMAQQEAAIHEIERPEVAGWVGNVGDAIIDVRDILGGCFGADDLQLSRIHVEAHNSARGTYPPRQLTSNVAATTPDIEACHAWTKADLIQEITRPSLQHMAQYTQPFSTRPAAFNCISSRHRRSSCDHFGKYVKQRRSDVAAVP